MKMMSRFLSLCRREYAPAALSRMTCGSSSAGMANWRPLRVKSLPTSWFGTLLDVPVYAGNSNSNHNARLGVLLALQGHDNGDRMGLLQGTRCLSPLSVTDGRQS